nr:ATP-binding protein [Azospirillum canadense]
MGHRHRHRPADQAAVFEDFRQLGATNRDRKQGLGLGLAIARRLSELLGLPVTLRSRPGKGSVFAVNIPFAGQDQAGHVVGEAKTPEIPAA